MAEEAKIPGLSPSNVRATIFGGPRKLSDLSDYQKAVDQEVGRLRLFIGTLGDEEAVIAQKAKLAYKLNRIDLLILHCVRLFLKEGRPNLASKKDRSNSVSIEDFSFFISNTLLVKKCQEALGIDRHTKDFANELVEEIIEKANAALKNLVEKEDLDEINRQIRINLASIASLETALARVCEKLSSIFESNMLIAKNLIVGDLSGLIALSKYLDKNYLSEETYPITYKRFLDSIIYREKMEAHLLSLMKQDQKTKQTQVRVSAETTLAELNAMNFGDVSLEGVPNKEKPLFKKILIELSVSGNDGASSEEDFKEDDSRRADTPPFAERDSLTRLREELDSPATRLTVDGELSPSPSAVRAQATLSPKKRAGETSTRMEKPNIQAEPEKQALLGEGAKKTSSEDTSHTKSKEDTCLTM